jgi:anti-sigma regulatory factor (Ser/Thr protein kinase)
MVAVPDAVYTSELTIQPRIADVRLASEWLARDGAARGVPQVDIGRLDTCLNEVLANVLSHGGDSAVAQPISLLLQVRGQQAAGEAAVTVTDAGPAFDATSAALKAHASSLAEATPGGLGLLMLRTCSDALGYQRRADRNVLTFTVRWA